MLLVLKGRGAKQAAAREEREGSEKWNGIMMLSVSSVCQHLMDESA